MSMKPIFRTLLSQAKKSAEALLALLDAIESCKDNSDALATLLYSAKRYTEDFAAQEKSLTQVLSRIYPNTYPKKKGAKK